jgi:predicted DCC family thiol-disulfide oxidoreductase YuxK
MCNSFSRFIDRNDQFYLFEMYDINIYFPDKKDKIIVVTNSGFVYEGHAAMEFIFHSIPILNKYYYILLHIPKFIKKNIYIIISKNRNLFK